MPAYFGAKIVTFLFVFQKRSWNPNSPTKLYFLFSEPEWTHNSHRMCTFRPYRRISLCRICFRSPENLGFRGCTTGANTDRPQIGNSLHRLSSLWRFFKLRFRRHQSQTLGHSPKRLHFHLQRPQRNHQLSQIQSGWAVGGLGWGRGCS